MEFATTGITQPIIHYRGWLYKAPPLHQYQGIKSCKRRYFIILQMNPNANLFLQKAPKKGSKRVERIHQFYLVYWQTDDVTKRPIRTIPLLENHQVQKFPKYGKEENMISFTTEERIYLFFAESKSLMNAWTQQLEMIIEYLSGKLSTPPTTKTERDSEEFNLSAESIYECVYTEDEESEMRSMTANRSNSHPESLISDSEDEYIGLSRGSTLAESVHPEDSASNVNNPNITPVQQPRTRRHFPVQAADSQVYEEMEPGKISARNKQFMSQETRALLERHNQEPLTPRVRRRSRTDLLDGDKSPKESDECGPRPFSVATLPNVRRNDVIRQYYNDDSELYANVSRSVKSTQNKNAGNSNKNSDKQNINYKLNASKEYVTLIVANSSPSIQPTNEVSTSGDELHIVYGDYDITVKPRDHT